MSTFQWIAVSVITVLSAARITRLLIADKFPPIRTVRHWYLDRMEKGPKRLGWQILAICPYCMAPYVSVGVVLWGYFTDWQTAWWIVNSISAVSYLAAIVVVNDGDDSEDF